MSNVVRSNVGQGPDVASRPATAKRPCPVWGPEAVIRLNAALDRRGYSLRRLSTQTGVALSTTQKIMSGVAEPGIGRLSVICRELEVSLDWIVFGDPSQNPAATKTPAVHVAMGFRVAVDALPVGRDIRRRLIAHLDALIAAIEVLK